ncbi:hypothetical protein FP2506_14489 [Fulvimarina pelagi HTCC2506]|uniref:Uncharacterized protein n=1 Tax=Fulvimarina pelagi HTCC2506 TaxID=314231 RepID=Q0G432_9HYPH|nr:tripartite tricarboxylate transporter substrate-binding protein [Fulvimarina pelagi]EAU41649.1 hypothetical protein FP2506_14489 [Fulvimarina pelagi HTCC2506]
MTIIRLLASVLIGFCCVASFASAEELDARQYYDSRTINLVVGYRAGGGYDRFARLVSEELEKQTGARVQVQNRPGAGGLSVLNDMAASESEDGLDLVVLNVSAAVTAQLTRSEIVRYDLEKIAWIGGIASDERALVLAEGLSMEALRGGETTPSPVRWAAGGKTDNLAVSAALISEAYGLDSRIITGYKGTGEAMAALIRGEADAAVVSVESAVRVANKAGLNIAAILARKRADAAPDVPTIDEIGYPETGKSWIDALIELTGLGRAIVVPTNTPADHIEFLREALRESLKSEDLLNAAEAQGTAIDPLDASALAASVAFFLAEESPIANADLRSILRDKYF